jgi:hypothetical protein
MSQPEKPVGMSHRAAARRFRIDPRTVAKMMKFTAPPGYVRTKPPDRYARAELSLEIVLDGCGKAVEQPFRKTV